jgi:hypothetical protein
MCLFSSVYMRHVFLEGQAIQLVLMFGGWAWGVNSQALQYDSRFVKSVLAWPDCGGWEGKLT